MVRRNRRESLSGARSRFAALIAKARATNRQRDRIERAHGHATPWDLPVLPFLNTVLSAIECGIITEEWDCIAEAYAMLEVFRNDIKDRLAAIVRRQASPGDEDPSIKGPNEGRGP